MKKILITGASGFIGSFLVEEALSRGYEVYAGVRRTSNKKYLSDNRIKFLELDFTNKECLLKQFQTFKQNGAFDYVIHNAGITKAKNKEEFLTVNYQYSRRLIEALIESGSVPKKFIYISSLAAFGPAANGSPIRRHTDIPKPITAYGESKLQTEQFLSSLTDFPFVVIRPAAVYGPRDHEFYVLYKLINRGIEPYIGFKDQLLSFVYVSDLAKIIFTALESSVHRRSYFVSDGFAYTLSGFMGAAKTALRKRTVQIVIPDAIANGIAYSTEQIRSLLGRVATFNRERLKEFRAPNWSCENEPLKNDLNFSPEFNLQTGMTETIRWYKEEKWL